MCLKAEIARREELAKAAEESPEPTTNEEPQTQEQDDTPSEPTPAPVTAAAPATAPATAPVATGEPMTLEQFNAKALDIASEVAAGESEVEAEQKAFVEKARNGLKRLPLRKGWLGAKASKVSESASQSYLLDCIQKMLDGKWDWTLGKEAQ
jgi:hypothetical protein